MGSVIHLNQEVIFSPMKKAKEADCKHLAGEISICSLCCLHVGGKFVYLSQNIPPYFL